MQEIDGSPENNSGGFPIDADAILNRLAEARNLTTGWGRDAALGREMGISSKRISGWRDRNTLDHLMIIHTCREWGLSINWVYYGDGSPSVVPASADAIREAVKRSIIDHLDANLDMVLRSPVQPATPQSNPPRGEAEQGAAPDEIG